MENEKFESVTPEFEEAGVKPEFSNFVAYEIPKKEKEKRELKKFAVLIGIALLLLMLFADYWGNLYLLIMQLFGFSRKAAASLASDGVFLKALQALVSITAFTLPFILVFKIAKQRIGDLVPMGKPKKGYGVALYFIGVSICAFANIINSYVDSLFEDMGVNYAVSKPQSPMGIFGFIISIISVSIVPALVEEFACRGIILGSLRKFGDGFAILVSSILFGLMHGNFDQMFFAMTVGAVLGFIVVKTESLWTAVAVHMTNNLISVLITYVLSGLPSFLRSLTYTLYLMAVLLIGIFVLAFSTEKKKLIELSKSPTESTLIEKSIWYFLSPVTIIFIAMCVLKSLKYFN